MRRSRVAIVAMVSMAVLLFGVSTLSTATANSNSVPGTLIGESVVYPDANDLKPEACAGLDLTEIISGAGQIEGTAGNDLILGGSGADTINGAGGDDCIVAGDGADIIDGGGGSNICIALSPDAQISDCEAANP